MQRRALSSKRLKAAQRERLADALLDARANAELIAEQLHVRLGRVLNVSYNFPFVPTVMDMPTVAGYIGSNAPPPPNAIAVNSAVQVTYEILP